MATETVNERIPVAKVRDDLDAVIAHARETKQPVFVTENGSVAIVIIDAAQYQQERQECELLRAILEGEDDVRKGRTVSHEEVEAMLDELLAE